MPLIAHVLKTHERIIMEYGTVSKIPPQMKVAVFLRDILVIAYAFAVVRRRPSKPRFFGLVSRSSTEKSSYVTISARELI